MNKVFGYTQNSGKDWFTSSPYLDREIEAIKDPQGGNNISLPTAIPTPFARIDLVKTAFKNIANTPQLKTYNKNGNVVASKEDEKLVSDALDLLELLYNKDNVPDLRIITWDVEASMQALRFGSARHRRFGETLKLYLDQDKDAYNFDLMKRIFLIEFRHKIIGGTSPVTLTFASANDLSFAHINLTGKDVLFDNKYASLYERDEEFQKYLYLLFRANPILSQRMSGVDEYLRKNLDILSGTNEKLYREINLLKPEAFNSLYSELDTGNSGEVLEVLGVTLKKRKKEDILAAAKNSDFVISSPKYNGENKPLVLQNNLNKDFKYINDAWDNKVKVPYFEKEQVLDKRILPGLTVVYPYLTVGDFLEPNLIRLVYPINKQKFFDGNVKIESGDDTKGYILPLKPLFFDFFDTQDLLTGKVKIELTQRALNAVKVLLHIPIAKRGEYITFERLYAFSDDSSTLTDEQAKKDGAVVEQQFGLTLFPYIKLDNPEIHAFYRIQLIDRNITGKLKNTNYNLQFYSNNNPAKAVELKVKPAKRSEKTAFGASSHYYVLESEFDYIQVRNDVASGIIIPSWTVQPHGNKKFSFAIDFGTTNTHIEYKVGNESPKPFDITTDDIQIATLFDPDKTSDNFGGTDAIDIRELIDEEFVPYKLGKNADYKFPHRTVLAESTNLDIKSETFTLADFNIPFVYGRKLDKGTVHTGLKWAKKDQGNEKRVRAYFEKLIMLLRNKVILGGGNLSETELIWFYPSSMKIGRKGDLGDAWNELFEIYFKPINKPVGIIESLAPFYYFKGANKLPGGSTYKPVVSIDIGGGTTDVVIFQKSLPLSLTSFKFASNTVFGDGFSDYGSLSSNGIADKYYSHFEELFATNKLHNLTKVLESMRDKNKAEDINTFFFSVENNPMIKDKSLFSFNAELKKDETFKVLFLYLFSAIIYHIAQLMKAKKIDLPKHLVFSGTGSKLLSIITSDLKVLSEYSKALFELVYNEKYSNDTLTITREIEMPKEVTCKGGLMCDANDLSINVNNIKTIFTCIDGVDTITYGALNEKNKNEIVTSVQKFNDCFFALEKSIKFTDSFNVSPRAYAHFKTQVTKNIRDYLEEGIEFIKKIDGDTSPEKEIEESLFFYPLTGIINNLTKTLPKL